MSEDARPDVAKQRRVAAELKRKGRRFDEIGRLLGISTSEAFQLLQEGHEESPKASVAMERQLDLERCDGMILALTPVANGTPPDPKNKRDKGRPPDPEAGRTLLLVMARRAKLLGLDAPTKAEITGKDGSPVQVLGIDISTLSDAQLEALIATNDVRSIGEHHPGTTRLAGSGAAAAPSGEEPSDS